jgi:hypothetical protein
MALPVLDVPTYILDLPSSKGKKVKYRPFLVKEEKILLIAIQENSDDVLYEAVKNIIKNCTFGELNVDNLSTLDIEYIFLQLRIKSKGSDVDLTFKCENTLESGEVCGTDNPIKFNLEDVKVHTPDDYQKTIMLTDDIGLLMKNPTLETSKKLQIAIKENSLQKIYDIIPDYIESVFQGDNTFEFTAEEFQEWLESLSNEQFERIQKFFVSLPKLRAEIPVKCRKCAYQETIVLEGLSNFLE